MDVTKRSIAYVGTYTSGDSEGIYTFMLEKDGKLSHINSPQVINNPSYLNMDRSKNYLYAAIEEESFQGEHGGGVAAFKIDRENGSLEMLNSKGTKGSAPCYLITDEKDKHLFVANYNEGTFTTYDISEDGSIGRLTSITAHEGTSKDVVRQEKAHVHYVNFTPDERYLFVVDLGIDKIKIYSLSKETERVTPVQDYNVNLGSGPRHIEFHPNGKYAYLINELSSDIVALKYSRIGTILETIEYISTLPENFNEFSACAAIHVTGDGKFLYASNRGHDSIAGFKIDEATGSLELISITPTGGEFPRDFEIDPSGKYLFAANQNSGTITSFEIHNETGALTPLEYIIKVPNPTCIKFIEI